MTTTKTWKSEYFYGSKISEYGLQNGYVDYRTLASAFQAVLSNDIISKTYDIGYWEQISGYIDYSEEIEELEEQMNETENEEEKEKLQEEIDELECAQEEQEEIYQYYIVDYNGAEILQEFGEIVFYNEDLDLYVWGVTHWGTSWDYVLTNIKIELDEE